MGEEAQGTPRFSIITVCLNSGNFLRETAESVFRQTFSDFEYLVQDGESSDGSLDQLPSDGRMRIVVESDDGIYDAMNRAAAKASGDYLCFLNAGDRFPGNDILSQVSVLIDEAPDSPPGLIYGNAMDERSGKIRRSAPNLSRKSLFLDGVCHQAQWIRRDVFLGLGGLNTEYRFRADQELLLRLVEGGEPTRHVDEVFALYDGQGFSAQRESRRALDAEWKTLRSSRYSKGERFAWGVQNATRLLWLKRFVLDTATRFFPKLIEMRRSRASKKID